MKVTISYELQYNFFVQVPFQPETVAELCKDAGFAADVYELVANLDTAIGFLHTVGGKPDRPLEAFMREDLRMRNVPLPRRVRSTPCIAFFIVLTLGNTQVITKLLYFVII